MSCRSRPESRESGNFNKMKDYLDKKFESMKQKMNSPPSKKKEADYSSFNKKSCLLNKKSCQKQHQFNFEQLELVEEAIELIEQGPITRPRLIKANLWKLNKCIKIAYKSPAGLKTVKKYEADSAVSDSEDDMRIRRAEKRAMKKSKSVVRKPTVR